MKVMEARTPDELDLALRILYAEDIDFYITGTWEKNINGKEKLIHVVHPIIDCEEMLEEVLTRYQEMIL